MKKVFAIVILNLLIQYGSFSIQEDEFLEKLGAVLDKKLQKLKAEVVFALSEEPVQYILEGDNQIAEIKSSSKVRFHNASSGVGIDASPNEIVSNSTALPRNCYEVWEKGVRDSGIYLIKPDLSKKPFKVLCDMTIQDGGWTHIQKRVDGHVDFYRGWRDYNFGFGYLDEDGEFWMGLRNIYALTDQQLNQLLIEIIDRQGEKRYALYENFAIGREEEAYPLRTVSGFKGDAGDSLTHHLGMKFSTFDFDQDNYTQNCAEIYQGAWWYKACHLANLNGKYINVDLPEAYKYKGLHWNTFHSLDYCHAQVRMLVKPSKL